MIERPEGGERALLVHLNFRDKNNTVDIQEFRELARSAGALVLDSIQVFRQTPDSKYFIGSGKVEELRVLVANEKVDLVLFDHSLTPAQERNLEQALKCRVVDRTRLILDIFAKRARSYEGKLQVEMAQLKYLSTRLVRGWTHLERQKGGIGLRGPGEKQLEVDRRLIRDRIKHIVAKLEKVRSQREQGRRARQRASLPTVSLVGYTNAGKSTLFNVLTGSNSWVANQLFATLDPTLRALELPQVGKVIIADTVGFVSKLPHDLVEAFQATLEEVKDSDLLLHVIDSHDANPKQRIKQVEEVLEEIGALALPRIEVYNKIDLLTLSTPHVEHDGSSYGSELESSCVTRIYISAQENLGIDLLLEALVEHLAKNMMRGKVKLSVKQARIRALLYEAQAVLSEINNEIENEEGSWTLTIALPFYRWRRLCQEDPMLDQCWLREE